MSLRFLFSLSAFACCSWSGRKSEKGEEGMSQCLDYNCSKSHWSSAKGVCSQLTSYLLSAHLALRSGWAFWESLAGLCPGFPAWQANTGLTIIQCSMKWPHFPLLLILVALVSSGVLEGRSHAASLVITGSWHGASTAAESCRGSGIMAALYQGWEKSLCSSPWTSGLPKWQILLSQDGDWAVLLMNAKVTQKIKIASKLHRYFEVYVKIPTRKSIRLWIVRGQLQTVGEAARGWLLLKWCRQ